VKQPWEVITRLPEGSQYLEAVIWVPDETERADVKEALYSLGAQFSSFPGDVATGYLRSGKAFFSRDSVAVEVHGFGVLAPLEISSVLLEDIKWLRLHVAEESHNTKDRARREWLTAAVPLERLEEESHE
jgi:hypothetical protein